MILSIHTAPASGAPQTSHASLVVEAGRGIPGDRHCDGKRWKGENLTLVESEVLDALSRELGIGLPQDCTRRNLVTCGVDLNALLGRRLRIGTAVVQAVKPCDPCRTLGRSLAWTGRSPEVLEAFFAGRGGLRCDVLEGGRIAVGDPLEPLD